MTDQRLFRSTMALFATGVTVVTARRTDGSPVGVTINSFASVSLKPMLIQFSLGRAAQCYQAFAAARVFAVNILSAKQKKISQHFAGIGNKHWGKILYLPGDHGCPLLPGSLGTLVCKRKKIIAAGDHAIFLGEVTELQIADGKAARDPLLYFGSGYRRLK